MVSPEMVDIVSLYPVGGNGCHCHVKVAESLGWVDVASISVLCHENVVTTSDTCGSWDVRNVLPP